MKDDFPTFKDAVICAVALAVAFAIIISLFGYIQGTGGINSYIGTQKSETTQITYYDSQKGDVVLGTATLEELWISGSWTGYYAVHFAGGNYTARLFKVPKGLDGRAVLGKTPMMTVIVDGDSWSDQFELDIPREQLIITVDGYLSESYLGWDMRPRGGA